MYKDEEKYTENEEIIKIYSGIFKVIGKGISIIQDGYNLRDYSNYRKEEIDEKLQIGSYNPLDIMVTGVTGAGKSSTLNSLFKKEVARVGDGVDPETMELDSYSLNDRIRFWDTPGLGDGVELDRIHSKKLIDLLYKTYTMDDKDYGWIDIVLVLIEGSNRDMGTTYKLLNEIIIPNFPKKRILIAINQADVAMKGRHWNEEINIPDPILKEFLEQQAMSIVRRVYEATGIQIIKPVYYSAERGYNITKFFNLIVDNIPTERREFEC